MLSQSIINRRKELGMSQSELSEKSDVCRQVLWRIEKNASDPRISTIEKLAKALNCTLSELLKEVTC